MSNAIGSSRESNPRYRSRLYRPRVAQKKKTQTFVISSDGDSCATLALPRNCASTTTIDAHFLFVLVQPLQINSGAAKRGPSPTFHVTVTGRSSPVDRLYWQNS